jgi:molecular chaperone GrpE (heat shock protein)
MLKKFVIIGAVFIIAGGAMFWLARSDRKKDEQNLQEQQKKVSASMDKVGEIATGEIKIDSFANMAAKQSWQMELDSYKAREETRSIIFTIAVACIAIGGAIFVCVSAGWAAWLLIKKIGFQKHVIKLFKRNAEAGEISQNHTNENPKNAKQHMKNQSKKQSKTILKSGWYEFDQNDLGSEKENPGLTELVGMNGYCLRNTATGAANNNSHVQKIENSLKAQAENLEKQLAEFKKMAQNVQQKSLEHSEPLKNSLKDLAEQVSAIREYASHQQDRVERLQNGYDWNIIKSFCLRVIRCIDNIENKIRYPSEQNADVTGLEEIRDELVFSLESSGVERFEPQLNSDYHGQEKIAEAIKERENCDDPNMTDKIANVIRAGYQYIIDDENVKMVRPAQVKLFGQSNLVKIKEN